MFATWVRSMKENWRDRWEHASEVEPTNLRDELRVAWVELHEAWPDIEDFDSCWKALGLVLRNLDITEVNTRLGQTPVINWVSTKFYILVGGQAIDRGFTVEGLTVTYMPRGAGTLTADTIQQRARFFGYKASYLGLCRVFLDPIVRDAYENYVHHERDMLRTLQEIDAGEDTLTAWKRRFLLDPSMRPTRASVIDIPMVRVSTAERWITDRNPVRDDALPLEHARDLASGLLADVVWRTDEHANRTGYATARTALEILEGVSPQSLLIEPNPQALGFALARLDDEDSDNPSVAVVWMRPAQIGRRTETADGGVQIFQGRSGAYPGDREIFERSTQLTLQLHQIQVEGRDDGAIRGRFLVTAWRLPEASSTGWLIQVGD